LPDVARRFPDTIAYIVGANPPPALIALGAESLCLRVLGFVEDVVPYLERSAVFVAPLRFGGGVKLKIIHAMARGIPVVTTKIGMEGIDGPATENALVGNTAESLVDHICALFADTRLAARIGTRGWESARQFYSWMSVSRRIEGIYEGIHQRDAAAIPPSGSPAQ
ncbi:MAG TPA: glycosyltransferase, partial [Bacteroidota bacterium]|nr:glycosyltransferase [Bacteroidota bacterium]